MRNYLKKGQVIKISGVRNTVINMIEFQEDTWKWQEYEIVDEFKRHKWLSIEENEGKIQYSLYEIYLGKINIDGLNFLLDGQKYTLYEMGTAIVKDYFGNADVDLYEQCRFSDYISEDKKNIISIEFWNGELEQTIGKYIDETNIEITDEIVKTSMSNNFTSNFNSSNNSSINNFNMLSREVMIICFLILIPLIAILIAIDANKEPIKEFLEKSSDFTYVTSVTNNVNNKKAKVYTTNLSVDQAVKKIIDSIPKKITKVVDNDTNEKGVGMFSKNEYAYVYISEDNKTMIQVSNKKYMNHTSSAYRTRHRWSRYYYNTYTSDKYSYVYNNYLNSARQSSVSSRMTSGGGISSGK